ncbi:Carbohydrate binding module (family 6) [Fibrobacter sp. UWB15]|uniref:family 43 glycosylhydrolase n=1 Tax=unclassified Fibrobacter TaxID=2634177 RepID=UPI00091E69BE|nr:MULTISPECIES: family 43 glycosylhydrolase [unclassified Fibrobacter]PWJ63802.1 carbohydrate binding protein with CBM6 domain [Fibrobacter sp. UWB6]SHG27121.1 Carbohydrate binding module (family 6) [Fibrobacter sp. UWB8]SMG34351.1 Carbohydrate binding module (family 6) [Fibrobacter sp. UWB15]
MMFVKNIKAAVALVGFGLCTQAMAENPLIQTYYSPDPAPVVFGDTLCTYSGNDEGGSFFTMHGWRVSCTTDMVNWTDMNTLILEAGDFNGSAKKNGDWASQCIRRNDKYYYYVTVESTRGGRAINVGVSDKKEGPFKDALNGKHLAGPNWDYIDPTVFIDDDGQAWLYWGNPKLYYCPLKENMIECASEIKVSDMSTFNGKYTEGPWIHKRGKKYYMIYAAGGIPESIDYSWSDSPTGPWTYKGVIMPKNEPGAAFTVHSGIVDFKGRSFFFYHNQKNVKGGGYSRSTAIEEFTWNADGTIPTIRATNNGVVKPIKNLDPFVRVEAETKAWVGGMTVNTSGGYTIIEHVKAQNGAVYLTNMGNSFYTKVRSVDMGDGADRIIVCTRGNGGKLELHAGSENGALLATMNIPSSSAWQENSFDLTDAAGVDDLFFVVKQGGFDFDYWYMESEKTAVPQTPYKEVAAKIPGKIEAENYDVGGHNKAFYDNDRENQGKAYREDEVDVVDISDSKCGDAACTGYAIGYTNEGEWVEYTIDVAADAKYDITANVATAFETSAMQLFIDDKEITELVVAPKVDSVWTTYKVVDVGSAELKKGEHVLKLLITGAYLNVDWIQFTDPNDTTTSIAKNVKLAPQTASYNVFGATGKFLGRVESGANMAATLKNAGFASGMYILRAAGLNKTLRVQVR